MPEVCVVYLVRDGLTGPEVLLGRKLSGLGEGKVVAPGGKLDAGESAGVAAIREVREAVGLRVDPSALVLLGRLTYLFPTKPAWNQISSAFRAEGKFGAPRASDEVDASWVSVNEVPLNE